MATTPVERETAGLLFVDTWMNFSALLLLAHPAVHGHLRGLTPRGGLRAPARARHDAGLQQVQAVEEAGDLLRGALRQLRRAVLVPERDGGVHVGHRRA